MNANNAVSVLVKVSKFKEPWKNPILERSLINANNVASILAKQEI